MSKVIDEGPAHKEDGLQIHDRIIEVCGFHYTAGPGLRAGYCPLWGGFPCKTSQYKNTQRASGLSEATVGPFCNSHSSKVIRRAAHDAPAGQMRPQGREFDTCAAGFQRAEVGVLHR